MDVHRNSTEEERVMRFRKLVPAVAAATSLLALAPAAALAHKHPSPRGRCRIDIESISPQQITAGEATEISGRLTCGRVSAAGQTVQLYAHAAGTAGYVPVQSATTEATGAYKLSTAAENTNVSFYVRALGAQSGRRRLRVAAEVTIAGPPEGTQIETGAPHRQTFSGTVTPTTDVGARVILQRQNAVTGDEWHRIGIGQVMAGGTYSIAHIFRVPGDASIRVLVRSDRLNVPSASTPLEYEISQAQNPSLEISSSADPIDYGQSATISGVLAGATTSQPVTLLARTVHQSGFAPVAEVSTGAGGSYTFPAQSPVNSTLYRVRAASPGCSNAPPNVKACKAAQLKSAVLYEGVKDVLTAEVSATTIQAGGTLEFKGTIAPDHTGHVIYLERQNAAGTGFHVVQVGRVLSGSVYSIVHQVYVPGTKVYRIDIPGGPDNGRAVSQLFTIQVTPAPASALVQEAPSNSSFPSEGTTSGSEAETPLSE
jgi:hypothetical protein